jgi:hypothetical protein
MHPHLVPDSKHAQLGSVVMESLHTELQHVSTRYATLQDRWSDGLTPAVVMSAPFESKMYNRVLTDSQRLSANIRNAACQSSKPEWIVDDTMLGVNRVVFLDDGGMKLDEQLLSDWRRRYGSSIEVSCCHCHDSSSAAAHDEAVR